MSVSKSSLNEELIRKLFYSNNTENYELVRTILHPEYQVNQFYEPGVASKLKPHFQNIDGVEGWISRHSHFRLIFPDVKYTIEQIFSNEEQVCVKVRGEGTHLGNTKYIEATNNPLVYYIMAIYWFKDDLIYRSEVVVDSFQILHQMGIINFNSTEEELDGYLEHLKEIGFLS